MTEAQIDEVVQNGKGRMPAFPAIDTAGRRSLWEYLHSTIGLTPTSVAPQRSDKVEMASGVADGARPAYSFTGYHKFLDPDGYPAVKPPWGTLNAIDLNTGKYLWKVPLGEYPELVAKGMKNTARRIMAGRL